mmetsp:Transcript_161170/g.517338  ORF Transcript_161170/g.517338 Transcript_161170/m.517338 type:complete len:146 (-) Transcript_161170:93-530(-)
MPACRVCWKRCSRWEPPLCAAARLGCPAQIFALLLEHGAQTNQENAFSATALDILVDVAAFPRGASSTQWAAPFVNPQSHVNVFQVPHAVADHQMQLQQKEKLATAGVLLAAGADLQRTLVKCGFRGNEVNPGACLRHAILRGRC